MTEIEALIEHLDTDESAAVNDPAHPALHHTAADDIATLLQRAISYGVAPYVVPTGTTTGTGDRHGNDARRAAASPAEQAPRRGGFPGAAAPGRHGGGPARAAGRRPAAAVPGDHHARHDHRPAPARPAGPRPARPRPRAPSPRA